MFKVPHMREAALMEDKVDVGVLLCSVHFSNMHNFEIDRIRIRSFSKSAGEVDKSNG